MTFKPSMAQLFCQIDSKSKLIAYLHGEILFVLGESDCEKSSKHSIFKNRNFQHLYFPILVQNVVNARFSNQ